MKKLNLDKLRVELARINQSRAWLARALGISKQCFHLQCKEGRADQHVPEIEKIIGIQRSKITG